MRPFRSCSHFKQQAGLGDQAKRGIVGEAGKAMIRYYLKKALGVLAAIADCAALLLCSLVILMVVVYGVGMTLRGLLHGVVDLAGEEGGGTLLLVLGSAVIWCALRWHQFRWRKEERVIFYRDDE
jgi:hypothetical protein